jgi:large subunit ribosomal protein L30e
MDIDQAIQILIKTGKFSFGTNCAIEYAKNGKVKMILISSNCPKDAKENLEHYCNLSSIPLVTYNKSSIQLAALCEKPFIISAISIREQGDSQILNLIKKNQQVSEEIKL